LFPVIVFAQEKEMSMRELYNTIDAEMKAASVQKDKKALGRIYGNLGTAYLNVAKLPQESIVATSLVSADKKVNLSRSIDYCNKSIAASEEVGDIEQMKATYKSLSAAQKMAGKYGDAVSTVAKMKALDKALLGKKSDLEKRQIEYENAKRLDSIRRQQDLAEQRLKEQNQKIAQQQQQQIQQQKQLEAAAQTLTQTQREKETVSKVLQKTQSDLDAEKTTVAEKDKQLTLAEQERALQAQALELQESKVKLQEQELKMKDEVLEQKKKQQLFYVYSIITVLVISLLVFRSFRQQKKSNVALLKEKKRSEELLLNILPQEVASELMEKGFADAKHFHNVTVLFTDFVSFTSIAEKMSPQELVGELHVCFKAFDGILGKYHIEKIKTVGDAYMAVSGLPISNPNHAADVVAAAIEIRDFMVQRKKEMGKATFSIRIGINSGEVVAGIVGVRKFSYDIWGDTVNIAARMEQNSEEGKINISESTYQLVKGTYPCIHRGKVEAKNKGGIDMYYVA